MQQSRTPLWQRPNMAVAAGETLRPGGFELTDRAAELFGLGPGHRVLDVGCGTGATVRRVRSRYGANAAGIDADFSMRSGSGACPYVAGSMERLPFVSGSFDMIFCECVLSLASDAGMVLREFGRVLAPGGVLAVSDFMRKRSADSAGKTNADSCAGRALVQSDFHAGCDVAGLHLENVEDFSRHAAELAARLAFLGESVSQSCACERPGYYLMMARKVE